MNCYKREEFEIIFVTDSKKNETQIPSRVADILNNKSDIIRAKVVSIKSPLVLVRLILLYLTANTKGRYILNTQHFKSGIIVWMLLGCYRLCGGKKDKIIRIHTLNSNPERARGIIKILLNRALTECECVIGVSKSVLKNYYTRNSRRIIYNVISAEDIQLLDGLAWQKNRERWDKKQPIKISWVGRFENIKRPMDMIDALLKIKNGETKIEIKVAGGGSLLKKIENKVSKVNFLLKKKGINLEICGAMSKKEAKLIIGESDIYINTSASETFSVSTAEAAIDSKKVLVLPELEAMKEIYMSRRTLFFESSNINHLSREIERAIKLVKTNIVDIENSDKIRSIVSEKNLVKNYENLVRSLGERKKMKKIELTGQAGSGKSTYLRKKISDDGVILKKYDCVGGYGGRIRGLKEAGKLGSLIYIGMTPLLLLLTTMSFICIRGRNMKDLFVGSASVYLKLLGSIGYNKVKAEKNRSMLVWDEGWLHIPFNLIPVKHIFLKSFLDFVRLWTNLAVIWNDIDEVWVSICNDKILRERTRFRKNARERRLFGEDLDEFYNQAKMVSATIIDELNKQGFKKHIE